MANQPIPTNHEIQAFLEHLQQYRASLNATGQQLLDTLVEAALGSEPHAAPVGAVRTYWGADPTPVDPADSDSHETAAAPPGAADWATTPWGIAHRHAPWLRE